MSENGQRKADKSPRVGGPRPDPALTEHNARYKALASRDPRFDGVFFVGVTSTGIYCRPICPAQTPQQKNCRFFGSAEAAEKASFRPCLRCRPELAPGNAPVDRANRIAQLLVHRLDEGLLDEDTGLEGMAAHLGVGSRQLRRIIQQELGVAPIELIQTRRLLLAKQLLTETELPVTEIAFASGFSSLRRFHGAFRSHYRMAPTRLRQEAGGPDPKISATATSTLQLSYRAPYDWPGILEFLRARLIPEVEFVADDSYGRTVRLGRHRGWIRVRHLPDQRSLRVEFTHSLLPVLPALLGRLRHLFDLTARPDLIAAHLKKDGKLKRRVSRNPGQRLPGAFDGFELAVRAILGRQRTAKAASTIAGRFAAAFGERVATPFPALKRLTPLAAAVAQARPDAIAKLGLIGPRSRSIVALARAVRAGALPLDPGVDPDPAIRHLAALPGIGRWTAQYIAMRALHWPDAFPQEDRAVRRHLGGVSAQAAEARSQSWRPWRSYAVLHLWKGSAAQL